MNEKDEVIVPFAANDGVESEEEVEESPELDIERLNTLLKTTENSLREMTNERNKERIVREKNERYIVMLKGDINRMAREKDELWRKNNKKNEDAVKADEKRRQAVEMADRLRAEMDTLRRSNAALRLQIESLEEDADADSTGDTTD